MEGTWLNYGGMGAAGTLRTNALHPPGFLSKMSFLRGYLAEVQHVINGKLCQQNIHVELSRSVKGFCLTMIVFDNKKVL